MKSRELGLGLQAERSTAVAHRDHHVESFATLLHIPAAMAAVGRLTHAYQPAVRITAAAVSTSYQTTDQQHRRPARPGDFRPAARMSKRNERCCLRKVGGVVGPCPVVGSPVFVCIIAGHAVPAARSWILSRRDPSAVELTR